MNTGTHCVRDWEVPGGGVDFLKKNKSLAPIGIGITESSIRVLVTFQNGTDSFSKEPNNET
jgi:hypothetical protein